MLPNFTQSVLSNSFRATYNILKGSIKLNEWQNAFPHHYWRLKQPDSEVIENKVFHEIAKSARSPIAPLPFLASGGDWHNYSVFKLALVINQDENTWNIYMGRTMSTSEHCGGLWFIWNQKGKLLTSGKKDLEANSWFTTRGKQGFPFVWATALFCSVCLIWSALLLALIYLITLEQQNI